jgi:hypothetical protein
LVHSGETFTVETNVFHLRIRHIDAFQQFVTEELTNRTVPFTLLLTDPIQQKQHMFLLQRVDSLHCPLARNKYNGFLAS